MENKISQCPICSSEALLVTKDINTQQYYDMQCNGTDCFFSHGTHVTFAEKDDAIDAWNNFALFFGNELK
jgi:hypothetical protein